mmetsp:Transcript_7522/g.10944  ORF Transcript_7522/g.10944 Transcript_7522/m.10944 type:complete len:265 (+) Transcript_7522:84-878(+)|eukprot:CAMPEP_0194222568 /NCGR_PEP_ID=MMETSP0156-20130528/33231_1 /TAXON_ID=33649 /ORGANISM="Thalassionema nitzschioides, Strain L26-B" /LENGTH=264 /DNA_ID=CAMNT_0038953397 /DNA_START=52 /DNA_END=846 /DNA_ORIENTATION=+
MSNSKTTVPEWTILYHQLDPPIAGRAQPIRLLFVDAGVEYTETGEGLYGQNGYCDMFRGIGEDKKVFNKETSKKHCAPYPAVAPPMIWHRSKDNEEEEGVFISQLPAIMRYVGSVLGYAPTNNFAETAKCDKILLDVCDYISEGRNSFHPVDSAASYHTQKEEGDRVSKEWSTRRMLIWLHSFEKILEKRTDSLYVVGSTVTYADIAMLWACEATEAQFDTDYYDKAWTNAELPLLKEFKQKFAQRQRIAAWSGRVQYCGDSMM